MEQKVFLRDSEGSRICGILSSPEKKTISAVIMCHGFSTSKDSEVYKTLARLLLKKGIATLRFDFYGHGESAGRIEDITLTRAVKNLEAAYSFVRKRGFSRIGVLGSSFGGAVAIIFASREKGIKCMALKSPVCDYREFLRKYYGDRKINGWKKRGYILYYSVAQKLNLRINYSLFHDAAKYDFTKISRNIRTPVLIANLLSI